MNTLGGILLCLWHSTFYLTSRISVDEALCMYSPFEKQFFSISVNLWNSRNKFFAPKIQWGGRHRIPVINILAEGRKNWKEKKSPVPNNFKIQRIKLHLYYAKLFIVIYIITLYNDVIVYSVCVYKWLNIYTHIYAFMCIYVYNYTHTQYWTWSNLAVNLIG